MSVAAFLTELQRQDIRVWMEGDQLRCNARAGALTEELRRQLRERKGDIMNFLRLSDALAGQQSAIVPLQQNGAGVPVFGVPGHTGDVFCYRAFAQALGDEQPFFALQPPGVDGQSEPLTNVEALAAFFAKQIRALRPEGPWIVAGYCMGGTVAFELARQLFGERKDAGFLAFFGVPYPTFFSRFSMFAHKLEIRARLWRERARLLARQSARERLAYLKWRANLHKQPPDPVWVARVRVETATLQAVREYVPRPFGGQVHHFVPCRTWVRPRVQTERWYSLASAIETWFGPEGCTADDMLLPQYAAGFAEQFRQSCARTWA